MNIFDKNNFARPGDSRTEARKNDFITIASHGSRIRAERVNTKCDAAPLSSGNCALHLDVDQYHGQTLSSLTFFSHERRRDKNLTRYRLLSRNYAGGGVFFFFFYNVQQNRRRVTNSLFHR